MFIFQTGNNALYICEVMSAGPPEVLEWTRITQTQQSITQLLGSLPTQQEFVYSPVTSYDADNTDAYWETDGNEGTLWFTTGTTPPLTLYGFNTPPTGQTGDEPTVIITTDGNGFLSDGTLTGYQYQVTKGAIAGFSGDGNINTVPAILRTLYSRPAAGVTPNNEVLTRVTDGTFEFREPAIGSQYAQTGTDNTDLHALAEITFQMIEQFVLQMELILEK